MVGCVRPAEHPEMPTLADLETRRRSRRGEVRRASSLGLWRMPRVGVRVRANARALRMALEVQQGHTSTHEYAAAGGLKGCITPCRPWNPGTPDVGG